MKLTTIKKHIIKNVIIIVLITASIGYFMVDRYGILSSTQLKNNGLESMINVTNITLNRLQENQDRYIKIVNDWQQIKNNTRYVGEVNLFVLKDDIKAIAERYKVLLNSISIAAPEEEFAVNKYMKIESFSVSIGFNAISDPYAVSFLLDLLSDLGGYKSLYEFSINRTRSITSSIVSSAREGKWSHTTNGVIGLKIKKITINEDK